MNLSGKIMLFLSMSFIYGGCGQKNSTYAQQLNANGIPIVAYVGATLIDGTGDQYVTDAVVLAAGGKILKAGSRNLVAVPDKAQVVDVSGKWIVPGLIDAHGHFFESGRIYTSPGKLDLTHLVSYEEEIEWAKKRLPVTLASYLCAGVTSVLSAGGPKFEYQARELAKSLKAAPDVFVAHGPITQVPAEVIQSILPLYDGDTSARSVANVQEARAAIVQASDWGADLIKTGYLGGPLAQMENDYVAIHEAIVAEANYRGFKVTAHVTEMVAAQNLIGTGIDSLQHVPNDTVFDDKTILQLKSQGVVVVPTLAVMGPRTSIELRDKSFQLLEIEKMCGDPQVISSWYEVEDWPPLEDAQLAQARADMEIVLANTKKLYANGVPLAAGSDAGNTGLLHGASLHYELKLLQAAGLSNHDLIVAATLNAARVAGKEDLIGSIESGKQADFLVLNANPLENIANLQAIEFVVKSGHMFTQESLLLH